MQISSTNFPYWDTCNKQTHLEFSRNRQVSPSWVPSCSLSPSVCRESWVGSRRSLWVDIRRPVHTEVVVVHQNCWILSGIVQESSKGPSWLLEACWLPCSSPHCSDGVQGLTFQQLEKQRTLEQALQSASTKGPVVAPSPLLT